MARTASRWVLPQGPSASPSLTRHPEGFCVTVMLLCDSDCDVRHSSLPVQPLPLPSVAFWCPHSVQKCCCLCGFAFSHGVARSRLARADFTPEASPGKKQYWIATNALCRAVFLNLWVAAPLANFCLQKYPHYDSRQEQNYS